MRTLDERVLLEACVENATQKPLQLVQVKCETLPGVKADPVHHSAYEQTANARVVISSRLIARPSIPRAII